MRKPWVTTSNYRTIVPDLIGVRAMHLYQDQWVSVHNFICSKWNIKKGSVQAFIQRGDPTETRRMFKRKGAKVSQGKDGYRSVHYETKKSIEQQEIRIEMQVRTLYQEAWGEVSHSTAYPNKTNDPILVPTMITLAGITRAAGSLSSAARDISEIREIVKEHPTGGKKFKKVQRRYTKTINYLQKKHPDLVGNLTKDTMEVSPRKLGVKHIGVIQVRN